MQPSCPHPARQPAAGPAHLQVLPQRRQALLGPDCAQRLARLVPHPAGTGSGACARAGRQAGRGIHAGRVGARHRPRDAPPGASQPGHRPRGSGGAHMGCSPSSLRMRFSVATAAGSCRWPRQYATSCRNSAEGSFRPASSGESGRGGLSMKAAALAQAVRHLVAEQGQGVLQACQRAESCCGRWLCQSQAAAVLAAGWREQSSSSGRGKEPAGAWRQRRTLQHGRVRVRARDAAQREQDAVLLLKRMQVGRHAGWEVRSPSRVAGEVLPAASSQAGGGGGGGAASDSPADSARASCICF